VFANASLSHMPQSLIAVPSPKRSDPNFLIGNRRSAPRNAHLRCHCERKRSNLDGCWPGTGASSTTRLTVRGPDVSSFVVHL
jgi:hypothetical protein